MPIPTQSDVHVNVPLTNLTEHFRQQQSNFVSMQVFPSVPVPNKSNVYYKWNRADFNRAAMKVRAPGAVAEDGGVGLTTGTYTTNDYALRFPIADQIRRNADAMVNLEFAATEYLTTQALIDREKKWATAFFGASLWGTTMTGQATADATHVKYWDASGSDPISDVLTGNTTIHGNTGFDANVLVLGYKVRQKLQRNAAIIDLLKYGQTGPGPVDVTDTALAGLFRVQKVLTMGAIETTSAEGANTDTFDFIGGSHALLVYAAPAPGLMVASGGYTFNWTDNAGTTGSGWRIKKYRVEERASDIVEIEQWYGHALVASSLGYFFASVLSA